MKYSYDKPKLCLLLFVLILFFISDNEVLAQGEVNVNVANINVRSGPGLEYEIISNIPNNTSYKVIDEQNNWYKVQFSAEEQGWLAGWLVEYQATGSNEVEETSAIISSEIASDKRLAGGAERFPIFSGKQHSFVPKTSVATYQSLGLISNGASLEVIRAQQGWFGHQFQGLQGWIATKVIERTQLISIFLSILQNKEEQSFKSQKLQVIDQLINVRSRGSMEAEVIDQLTFGRIVELIEEQEEWAHVSYDDKEGWVASYLLSDYTEETNKPITITIANDGTNLRSGAGTNYTVVGRANAGESFPVLNKMGDWFEISLSDGAAAYVAGWIVNSSTSSTDNTVVRDPNHPLQGKKIVVDPGHGGKDSGAIGPHFGSVEKILNLEVSNLLKTRLEEAGAVVYMTRTDDRFISLQQRIDVGIISGADAFLSIHHNTNDDSSIHGTITYFYSNVDRVLANILQEEIVKKNGLKDLNARRGDYFVLRENPRPSVLIELGFLTNYNDEINLSTKQSQQSSVEGIYNGLIRYFDG